MTCHVTTPAKYHVMYWSSFVSCFTKYKWIIRIVAVDSSANTSKLRPEITLKSKPKPKHFVLALALEKKQILNALFWANEEHNYEQKSCDRG